MPYKDRETNLRYHRDYWKKNPERVRDRKLKKTFGISLEEYLDLLSKQRGVCAICFKPEKTIHGNTKKVQHLSVDHNHITKKVRGLLCSNCNTALGLLDENAERAQSMISYLGHFDNA